MNMSKCPIVETSLGKAKGQFLGKIKGGKDVYRYSSLPFAKPPVGELRFELPVKPDSWSGILDATKQSASPLQNVEGIKDLAVFMPENLEAQKKMHNKEDCLYLSVYTSNPSKKANMPVFFWIYGGAFMYGEEAYYDARVLASLHDIVVVIPNYRVTVFGFLSLGKDTDYPGNIGLHDQIMALKWTQSHIKSFGGNPEKVTIAGESAGAISVGYHVMSPLSKGLFHQAISNSGTFFSAGYPAENGDASLNALLERLKITEKDPKDLIKKLKDLPAEKILKIIKEMEEEFLVFIPVIDGKFFPKDLAVMGKEPVINNVPYIVGFNNTEGHGLIVEKELKGFKSGITKEVYEESLKNYVGGWFYPGLPDAGFAAITKHYEKGKQENDKKKWSKMYGEIQADIIFVSPAIKALKQHVASKGKAYMYVMKQQLQFNHQGPENARKADFCECDHGDDLVFTFGIPLTNQKLTFDAKFTADEKKLSREWIKYIANFVTNGDPNKGSPVKVKWPQYDPTKREALSVQQPCSIEKFYGEENHKFWNEVVDPMRPKPGQTTSF